MQHHALRSVLSLVLVAVLAGVAAAGTTGKIRGRATDKSTGEALVGASIVIETTTMGASADVNGEFTILGVPPGAYTVRAAFVGYKPVVVRNVRVTVDLTTEVNFQLESQAIPGPTIEIVVQSPLVNKSATNQVVTMTSQNIEQLPVRNVTNVFALTPGVVQQGGAFYVRGGRLEETAFYVDGVLVNSPMNGQLNLNVINNAIEEVQTQIGGMTAQYGNAMSGLVNTTTKIGGTKYNGSVELITDQLGGVDSKNVFGAYSFGQSEYVATIGGPIIPDDSRFRFFVAGQRVFNRSAASFQNGLRLPINVDSTSIGSADWIVLDRYNATKSYTFGADGSTGRRTYLANLLNNASVNGFNGGRNLGGADQNSYSVNGNLYADLGSANVKIGGTYNHNVHIDTYGRGLGIASVLSGLARGNKVVSSDMSLYAKLTYFLNPTTYFTAQGNYFHFTTETGDQIFWDNIEAYGDPAQNPVLVGPSTNPPAFSVYSFTAAYPGSTGNTFNKSTRSNYGGRVDFTHQFAQILELKAGAELNYYTIRTFAISPLDIYLARLNLPGGSDWAVYNNAGLSMYGYDIYGNEFNGGSFTDKTGHTVDLSEEGPRHPIFSGAYLQSKFEFEDLIINAGLRYDFFNPGAPMYTNPLNIGVATYDGIFVIADTSYTPAKAYTQLSPRLGFSFPIADRTVFHATYGKFMQMGRLNDLYTTPMVAAFYFKSGYAYQQPNPNLKPERTTDYEVGFRQQVGDEASFDLSFYYKDTKDLHVIRVIFPPGQNSYYTTINGDFGTSKGLTLTFQMRRTNRVAMNANYTLSSSTATGSSNTTHFDIAWQDGKQAYFPVIPAPTDFDRTHTGNINLDYRFDKDDGPTLFGVKPLERAGLNLLLTFSSGKRYTYSAINGAFRFSSVNGPVAYENLNTSEGPWIYQLDLKLDKSFVVLGDLDLNVYLWITNLFNRKNVENGVYTGTGLADNDGWLNGTAAGQTWAANNGPKAVALYQFLEDNLGFYGPPRQVRLGVRLAF